MDVSATAAPQFYIVSGMGCSACAEKITLRLKAVQGIEAISVDYETRTAKVQGTATLGILNDAVATIGRYILAPKAP